MVPLGQNGVLQVIPPAALEQQLQEQANSSVQTQESGVQATPELAGYIKTQFEIFRNHRNTAAGWSERLLVALRTFNGQYDASKLAEIRKFGGSEVYARMIAQKCRAASSLLRDVYLGPDRPWALKPPADPKIPQEIVDKITQLIQAEGQMVAQTMGKPPSPSDLQERKRALIDSAKEAAKKKANGQAKDSEDKVESLLREGGFYHALAEFLVDLPIFPFACIKGPIVRVVPEISWDTGAPQIKNTPKLHWVRVSPFDLWMTPGVSDIANADIIEKGRITRSELNELLDLPGYNHDEIRQVLDEYGRGGLYDNWDTTDAERATLESRENPAWNRSNLISVMEYNGNVQGRLLQDYGMVGIPDELRDYNVQAWVIGSHVIKAHLSPSPRQRHPYFITSFEKVPGTPVGNGLTDLLSDIQEVTNATLRALVNNLSIASGPQVVVDLERLDPQENGEDLYPWKRWYIRNDPVGKNNKPAIEFWQPNSNSQQLLEVIRELTNIADDVSAIPKYIGGQGGSGAGRTASGLAMLMGNASKILQTVSANIDRDILEPCLTQLSDLILLTDTSGLLTGEEDISVQGVNVAVQRETVRQRQIEFLATTANPLDQKIMGVKGRGAVLRSVSQTIGLDGESVVPADEQLEKMEEQEKQGHSPIDQAVQEGVVKGVEAGVQRISSELTSGLLASRASLGSASPPGGGMDQVSRQAQGGRAKQLSQQTGPSFDAVGNQPRQVSIQGGD